MNHLLTSICCFVFTNTTDVYVDSWVKYFSTFKHSRLNVSEKLYYWVCHSLNYTWVYHDKEFIFSNQSTRHLLENQTQHNICIIFTHLKVIAAICGTFCRTECVMWRHTSRTRVGLDLTRGRYVSGYRVMLILIVSDTVIDDMWM